ncbi:MAG: endo-1,4-beta-xylanase, partial [Bifidobacteriaceae bacterium]|nr:endo-1,4-beta-xylanase [Bifidobacteriaceae bacterium]
MAGLVVAALLGGGGVLASAPPAAAATGDVIVHLDQQRQEIEGFVASGAFRQADDLLNYLPPAKQKEILDLVFSKDDGIGVSIWRNMSCDEPGIGDYRWATYGFWWDGPCPTFKTAATPTSVPSTVDVDGVSDFNGDNYRWWFDSTQYPREGGALTDTTDSEFSPWGWTQSPTDRGQVWAMKKAQEYDAANGDEIQFVTSLWSAPVWMKSGGTVTSPTDTVHTYDGFVPAANYQAFADYVADYVQGYEKVYGIPIAQISLSNEPDHSGNYSSSFWNADTYRQVLKYVGAEFAERGITTKIQGVEAMSWNATGFIGGLTNQAQLGYGTGLFRDPDALQYLGTQGYHSYSWTRTNGSQINNAGLQEAKARAVENDQEMWSTEISLMSNQTNNIANAVGWSQFWGRQLGIAEMNAVGHWWAWGYKKIATASGGTTGTVSAENLIYLENSTSGNNNSGVITGEFTGNYEVARWAYGLGHYAKFVRPGWKRVNLETADFVNGTDSGSGNPSDLVSTAFMNPQANPDGSHDIAVVMANGATAHTANVSFPGYTITNGQQYLTDATVDIVHNAPTAVAFNASGSTPLNIAANSIYTFTGKAWPDSTYSVDATSTISAANYASAEHAYTNKDVALAGQYVQVYDVPGATAATSGNTGAELRYENIDFGAGANVLKVATSDASSAGTIPVRLYVDGVDAGGLVTSGEAVLSAGTGSAPTVSEILLTRRISGVHDIVLVVGAAGSARTVRLQSLSFGVAVDAVELTVSGTYRWPVALDGYVSGGTVPVTVTGSGTNPTGNVTVSLIGPGAGDFDLSPTDGVLGVLAPDATATFTLTPKADLALGVHSATVQVSDGVVSQSFVAEFVVASTTGGGAPLVIAQEGVSFGKLPTGYTAPAALPVTAINVGAAATEVLPVALQGADAAAFALSAATLGPIGADGGRASVSVAPVAGLPVGTYEATVIVGTAPLAATVQVKAEVAAAYVVTVTASGNGTVTGGGTYFPGDTVALTAIGNDGQAWNGWTSTQLEWIGARANSFTMPAGDVSLTAAFRTPIASLKDTYGDYFDMGNIYSSAATYQSGSQNVAQVDKHYSIMTAENYMKPNQVLPNTGINATTGAYTFNWANADAFVSNSLARGLKIHGHVLVWHDQSPARINSGTTGGTRALARENMRRYIEEVLGHFKDKAVSWDVVNEAFVDEIGTFDPSTQDWRNYLRGGPNGGSSNWWTAYGNGMDAAAGEHQSDFLYDAFVYARQYGPEVKLYYNDFNIFQSEGKGKAVLAMAQALNARYAVEHPEDPRALVEGVGFQAHNYIAQTPAFACADRTQLPGLIDSGAAVWQPGACSNHASVEASIQNFVAAGFDLSMSELDLF